MATSTDSGPSAGSNLAKGAVTATRSFVLPAVPRYLIQSVTATVVNTAGGDTTGTLTVTDPSGEVIGAVEQGRVISAGVTGRATWALRLADETSASGSTFVPEVEYVDTAVFFGDTIAANDYTALTWARMGGATLLDYTDPKLPTVIGGGLYAFTSYTQFLDNLGGWVAGTFLTVQLYPPVPLGFPVGTQQSIPYVGPFGVIVPQIGVTLVVPLNAGDAMKANAGSNQPTAGKAAFGCIIARLSESFS